MANTTPPEFDLARANTKPYVLSSTAVAGLTDERDLAETVCRTRKGDSI